MSNDRPTKLIVDAMTGEQTVEFLTDEEITQMKEAQEQYLAQKAQEEAEAAAIAAAKASAITKLATLGLTAEEIAALSK